MQQSGSLLSGPVADLARAGAAAALLCARSSGTQRGAASALRSWARFCHAVGADPSGSSATGQPVSKMAAVEFLCSYVAFEVLIRGNSPATLERSYLGHIDYYFKLQYDDPFIGEARRSTRFLATFEGFRRIFHIVWSHYIYQYYDIIVRSTRELYLR